MSYSYSITPPTSPQATVESLSARLATLETTASHEASAAAVKEAQLAMLLQLREVKASLMAEGGGASGKEVEGLKEENAKLKLKNEVRRELN